ncbi:hypothetical protein F2Q69_00009472 [Brassica cretica]|uniref:Uncharacterized protein n=1 Tax=Brassica cretica TaxID=69181 RepID=A0A8S9PAJ9_BRACR|nr:hypothetical protein F2Q69_00009472 [Brassica cretica]
MLRLSITNKALSQVQVEKLLDGSLRILDLCNVAKDALSQMKEGLKDIQSTLQRKCGDLSAEVKKYLATRNILKKSLQKVQVEKLLDGSLRILDLCNVAKDALSQMKEGLKDIQSTLQRKCGDLSAEVKKYLATRNILKKSLQKVQREHQ